MSIDLSDNLEKSLGTQTSFKICSGKKINRVRHRLLDVLWCIDDLNSPFIRIFITRLRAL